MIIAGEIHGCADKIIPILSHNGSRIVERGVRTARPPVYPLGDCPQLLGLPPRALGAEGVGTAGKDLVVVLQQNLLGLKVFILLIFTSIKCKGIRQCLIN